MFCKRAHGDWRFVISYPEQEFFTALGDDSGCWPWCDEYWQQPSAGDVPHAEAGLLLGDAPSALLKGQSQEVAILKENKFGGLTLWRRATCFINCCF